MYLINTTTLSLKFYLDWQATPTYAILSHRWTDSETTHKDYIKHRNQDSAGYKKICEFCAVAKQGGYQWVWVDTCCIDKRSSAELQEAINSMFLYYETAEICYVHLADVRARSPAEGGFEGEFMGSEWFKRGWTLQELLAPGRIAFYSKYWDFLGVFGQSRESKMDGLVDFEDSILKELVAKRTGISEEFLPGRDSSVGLDVSVACRMSWASMRKTTREDDMAYCLLGIFGVQMPLLYGEGGKKAFLRLQEEIMKTSDGHSLFAWTRPGLDITALSLRSMMGDGSRVFGCIGLLAKGPSWFMCAQNVVPSQPRLWADTDPYELTSRGVKIVLKLSHCVEGIYLAKLDCESQADEAGGGGPVLILMRLSNDKQIYQRITSSVNVEHLGRFIQQQRGRKWSTEAVYIQQGSVKVRPTPDLRHPLFLYDDGRREYGFYYQLELVTRSGSANGQNNGIVQCCENSYMGSGFNIGRLHVKEFAILSIGHILTRERLFVRIAWVSDVFIGFDAILAAEATLNGMATPLLSELCPLSERKWIRSSSSEGCRDEARYHCVAVTIKSVGCGDENYYLLGLDLSYEVFPVG